MKKSWQCICILFFIIGAVAGAAAFPAEAEGQTKELEVLGRNIRLNFKAVPLEEGDNGIYVITASPDYEASIRLEGDDGKIEFSVSGEVKLLDDGRIFVRCKAYTILKDKSGEFESRVCSAVILQPGQELGVSRMGDKVLMISASEFNSKGVSE